MRGCSICNAAACCEAITSPHALLKKQQWRALANAGPIGAAVLSRPVQ